MTDRRLTPANGTVAGTELQGMVTAARFVEGTPMRVAEPVVDLLRAPGGRRERQMLLGTGFRVLDIQGGVAFGQSARDGYVGYVAADALVEGADPTHMVCTPATHLYPRADIKAQGAIWLSFGSALRVVSAQGAFFETEHGFFVPKPHLRPLNAPFKDPVTVAQLHFGVPYLWGGNSALGIDCSGVVQAALMASGIACPGDSDMQEAGLGTALAPGTPVERGDLLFWKGHVAMAVDQETMIHANAHHMAVAYEGIESAIKRILVQGGGPLTAHKRL